MSPRRDRTWSLAPPLAAALLAAAPGPSHAVSPGQEIGRTREFSLILAAPGQVRSGDGVIEGMELRGEVIDPAAAGELGYKSIRSRVDIDCRRRRDRVVRMETYAGPRLSGSMTTRPVPGGWAAPAPGAYLAAVIDAICAPQAASKSAPARPAMPLALTAVSAVPTPRPPPQPIAPASLAGRRGAWRVQVTAADSEAAARATLSRLSLPEGLGVQVETVTVHGRLYHRGLVTGFGDAGQASGFCAALKRSGGDCLVRPG